jgi:DnaJ-domain-containing protein 1
MSDIFNRLGRLARSVINDFNNEVDSDYKDAWAELDGFLGTEAHQFEENSQQNRNRAQARSEGPNLARDYANLELGPAASNDDIRRQYRKLLVKYHPDKFAASPEKQQIATELTARLNESYDRIAAARGID